MLAGIVALAGLLSGCGVRTLPPIRYVPLLGTEKKITTTEVLARALRDRDVAVRAQAVRLLGVLSQGQDRKVKAEVARVLGVAARDRDPGIRLLAIDRLGSMEERLGNKYLHAALKDPNPFVRAKVLTVLARREETPQGSTAPQQAASTP